MKLNPETSMAFIIGFSVCYLLGGVMCMEILLALHYPPDMAASKSANWIYTTYDLADQINATYARQYKLQDRVNSNNGPNPVIPVPGHP